MIRASPGVVSIKQTIKRIEKGSGRVGRGREGGRGEKEGDGRERNGVSLALAIFSMAAREKV